MVREARVTSRVPNTQADFDKLAAQLNASGFFFTLAGGRVTELRVPGGLSALTVNLYRDIASRLQFARSAKDEPRYEVEELDGTGAYVAEYRREASDAGIWRKRKLRYLHILTARGTNSSAVPGRIVPEVVQSQGEIRLSSDGRPELVHVRDEVAVNGAQTALHAKNSFSLEAPEVGHPAEPRPDFALLIAKTERLAADEPYGGEAQVEALDDARIQGLTFDVIIKRLEALAKTNPTPARAATGSEPGAAGNRAKNEQGVAEESRLFTALAATFRKKPETVAAAMKKIHDGSAATNVLVDALGSSGSKTAHAALAELASKKTANGKLRSRAVYALARTSVPSEVSIDAMKAILTEDPFNVEALYGLGTYARRLRDARKPDAARAIGDFLIERLGAARTMSEQVAVLGAVTNSGYDPALPKLVPLLTDPREPVRASAVRALQSMQSPEIDGRIAERLASDKSSQVALSAIEAASVREPSDTLAKALTASAIHATDPRVRYRAVDLLIDWMPKRPDVRTTIARVAASDTEGRVRDRAKAAL